MIEPSHPLIEAATKYLAHNAELHVAGKTLLNETFDPSHPNIPGTLEKLEQSDSKKSLRFMKWLLPSLAIISVIILGLLCHSTWRSLKVHYTLIASMASQIDGTEDSAIPNPNNLLLGDPSKSNLENATALLASDPNRPDYYSEFAASYYGEHGKLPPDYFETISRIDPDNSFFLYYAVGVLSADAVKKVPRTGSRKNLLEPDKYEILNPDALSEAIELFLRGSQLPRYDNYTRSLTVARMELLRHDRYTHLVGSWAYIAGTTSPVITLRRVADAFAAQAALLSEKQDNKNLLLLFEANERHLKHYCDSPVFTLVEELVYRVISIWTTKSLHAAFKELGIDESEHLKNRVPKIVENEMSRKSRKPSRDEILVKKHGGMMQAMTLPMILLQVQNPSPITKKDLAPSRNVERDVVSQFILMIPIIIIFLCIIPVALFRYRTPAHARLIADRIGKLITTSDWLWIIGAGIVLPLTFIFVISRHTALGGNEYNMLHFKFTFPLYHYLIIAVTLLATPILIIRWRIKIIISPFGIQSHKTYTGWILLALGIIVTLITFPILKTFPDNKAGHLIRLFPILWLIAIFITACRALLGKKQYRLSRAICSNALIPTYSVAVLLLAALYPILVLSERQNIAKDKITTPDPNYPGLTPFEYKITEQLRSETKEMLRME